MLRALVFAPLVGLSVMACAQFGFGYGSMGYGTIVYTGWGVGVAPEDATWLESDVDERPVFPGGGEALAQYFSNVPDCSAPVAPTCAKKNKVLVWFIVEQDGSVQEAWIDRGGCAELQEKTICTVLHMPSWTPGMRKGHPVRTRVRIPVVYRSAEGQ